jgi:DNA polymerase-3 subunit delta'
MTDMWQNIQGHDAIVQRFQRALSRGRLAGSFLFVGPPGVGKRHFALALAKGLLCKTADDLNPCGTCESCKLFGATNLTEEFVSLHPDLYCVSKPADKSLLPLELLVGNKEHRGHAGLCYDIFRTPFVGKRKVAVIVDADFLNAEGANSLLKTLEEPPSDSVIILIGTSTTKQLPTIRSRCQIVRFAPLSPEILSPILVEQKIVSSLEEGQSLASRAEGSLDYARELQDGDIEKLRSELTRHLSASPVNSVGLAETLNGFVESVGKEAPLRRRRLRLIFGLAISFFRDQMKNQESVPHTLRHLGRTLDALEQIDRNANLPYVVEAWASEL